MDMPSIFQFTFSGYDASLFSDSNTLAYICEHLSMPKVEIPSDGSAAGYHYQVNFLTAGAIPFIYVMAKEEAGVNYLEQWHALITDSSSNTSSVNWSGSFARYNDEEAIDNSDVGINDLTTIFDFDSNDPSEEPYLSEEWEISSYAPPYDTITNIPIFLVSRIYDGSRTTEINQFMQHLLTPEELVENSSIVLGILNGETEEPEEETFYYYEATANQFIADSYGNISRTNQPQLFRGLRFKIKGKAALYAEQGINDGALKCKISKSGPVIVSYYSSDGQTWPMPAGDPTTLYYDWLYRYWDGEVGTFYCANEKPLYSNMYLFETKEDADNYVSDPYDDGRKAINFGDLPLGPYEPLNPTGEESSVTEFGQVYTKGFFSQQYILNEAALYDIANALYDTQPSGIWEDIKKGLDMYGANPIDAVMGLSFWPFKVDECLSGTLTQNYVYFGGYQHTLEQGSCKKIIYPNGYKSLGSVFVAPTFNNWRDFAPYTRLYVRLPYCGCYELDPIKYYNKSVEVRYFFDTRTNTCLACLIADNHLMDYYNGQMGVSMPMTLTDFSQYAASQIQTLLGFGGQTVNTGMNAAANAGQLAAAGAGSAALGIAGVGIAGAAIGAKAVYGLSTNNINKYNQTKGGSSSMINEYLPQYVEFIFEIQEDCAPSNYGKMLGFPSMKEGTVGSFSGLLQVASVKLNCPGATENEKEKIIHLLTEGIYI